MVGKSSVDKLKDRLYSRGGNSSLNSAQRSELSERHEQTPHSWDSIRPTDFSGDTETAPIAPKKEPRSFIETMPQLPKFRSHSIAPYFFWGSIGFFLIAFLVAAYAFFAGGNTISPQNIDLEIVAPSLIDSGKQATLEFIIDNRNQTTLQTADLIITYPDGTRSANDPTQALTHERRSLGDISSGQQLKQTVLALFYGPEGSQQKIAATLEYQIAGSNAVFQKQVNTFFTIGSAPLSLSVSAPNEAISGQPFMLTVTAHSNSVSPIDNVAVEAQYPFGFSPQSSSPNTDVGNSLWRLGTLDPGGSKTITLTGMLTGEDGDERVFHFLIGSESDQTETHLSIPLLTTAQTVVVRKPFVSGQIALDGQGGETVAEPLGKNIDGTIVWQNNTTSALSNLTFALSLSGPALNQSSIKANNGFYDSTKSQIIWDASEDSALTEVPPGASGTLQFSFATLLPNAALLTNPTVALNLTVHAARKDDAGNTIDVSSAAHTNVSLASVVSFSQQASHFAGSVVNTGPMPPKVGQATTYSIVWTVKNSSNTIAGAQVSATLPPYVSFVTSSGAESLSYNDSSRSVTWSLGDVKAGTGYSQAARQATFQVSLLPSISQVGATPSLIGEAKFSGQDRFAQANIEASAGGVNTQLSESGFSPDMGSVTK